MTLARQPEPDLAGRLRRVAAALASDRPLLDVDRQWLVTGIALCLAERQTLDSALGLVPLPGRLSWRDRDRYRQRDALIRELADSLNGSASIRAAELQRRLRSYAGSGWPRDRHGGAPTSADPERELLYRLFTLDPNPPMGVRRLIDIIGTK